MSVTTTTGAKVYEAPGQAGSVVEVKARYENFIGGHWVAPVDGQYMKDLSPATARQFTEVPRSTKEDIELALDAAYAAKDCVGRDVADRARQDPQPDRRRDRGAHRDAGGRRDLGERQAGPGDASGGHPAGRGPLPVLRRGNSLADGTSTEIDKDTVAYHFHEPLGVVGQIIPFNFPLLMAAWKMAPALAGGNCTVIKPASSTPWSILKLAELISDIVPPGVINIVTGPGGEIGKALATNRRIAKIGFTGETVTGRLIMQYAAENIIPSTTELGGKSPNIFFADVMAEDDEFLDKAVEGLVLYAFNKGEVCTCPSRALIQESIYDRFMERCPGADRADQAGQPARRRDPDRARRTRPSSSRRSPPTSTSACRRAPSADRRQAAELDGELADGYYFEPTVLKGHNKMRVFQEEIFGPVLAVTTFTDEADALGIANDTLYGLGAGVWTRNGNLAYRMGRAIKAGRVWTNCYHLYPAGAAFGGYKISGVGRENHQMMLRAVLARRRTCWSATATSRSGCSERRGYEQR